MFERPPGPTGQPWRRGAAKGFFPPAVDAAAGLEVRAD
jgi:hypothetical protein